MALIAVGRAYERTRDFLTEELWHVSPEPNSLAGRALSALQFIAMIAEGFIRDHLLLRASALAYFTALSLIPMLAVAIGIIGAIGVRGSGDFVAAVVRQVAAGSPEAQAYIIRLIENANFGGLGTVGAIALFLTTVFAVSNIEMSLNEIWGVTQHRSWARRFPDYLAVLVVAPLLLVGALSVITTLQSQKLVQEMLGIPEVADAYRFGLQWAPAFALSIGFAFLYWILPNTRVSFASALLGGSVAGALVFVVQRLYLDLNVGVARYNALFGGFSAIPLLFAWIYLFWAMVLFGAEVAFAYQNLDLYRREVRGRKPCPAEREAIGLKIALMVARAFRDRGGMLTAEELGARVSVPVRTVREVLRSLEAAGVVAPRGLEEQTGGYQLGRPAEDIAVLDVIEALRGRRETVAGDPEVRTLVSATMSAIDEGLSRVAAGRSLADLLAELPGAPKTGSAPGASDPGSV